MLTCSTAWAALSVENRSISAADRGAGDLAAHGSRVLHKHRDPMYSKTHPQMYRYPPDVAAVLFQILPRCGVFIPATELCRLFGVV